MFRSAVAPPDIHLFPRTERPLARPGAAGRPPSAMANYDQRTWYASLERLTRSACSPGVKPGEAGARVVIMHVRWHVRFTASPLKAT